MFRRLECYHSQACPPLLLLLLLQSGKILHAHLLFRRVLPMDRQISVGLLLPLLLQNLQVSTPHRNFRKFLCARHDVVWVYFEPLQLIVFHKQTLDWNDCFSFVRRCYSYRIRYHKCRYPKSSYKCRYIYCWEVGRPHGNLRHNQHRPLFSTKLRVTTTPCWLWPEIINGFHGILCLFGAIVSYVCSRI